MAGKPTYEDLEKRVQELEKEDREIFEHFRKLAEATFDGIVIMENGVLVETNRTFASLFEYEPTEIIGMKAIDLIAPESRALVSKNIRSNHEGPYEATVLRKDGTRFEVEASGTPISYKGRPARLTAMRDITERKRAQEAILESEAKYSAVVQQARDGIVVVQDEAFVYVNKGWEQISGYTSEELLGTSFLEFLLPGSKELVAERAKHRLTGEPGIPIYEAQFQSKNGKIKTLEVSGGVIQYEGKPANVAVLRDITEREEAVELLRKEKDFTGKLLQASPTFFVAMNAEGRTLMMNETMLTALGYTKDEIEGTDYLETFVPVPVREPLATIFQKIVTSSKTTLNRNPVLTKDGRELLVEWHGVPLMKEDGELDFFFGVGIDITERVRMEEEIARNRKIESLGILAGGLAHDFNNLLTPIMTSISMAKMYGNSDPEITEMLTDAEKASYRAKDLTQQLLTFAKGGAPIKKTISLAGMLWDTAKFALSGSNVKCKYSIPDDLWPVEVDEGQISQVIHNMVINADQAMAEGGTLKIRAENMILGKEEHVNLEGGRYVGISIEDQGHGIPQNQLSKIFDPFFTIKEKGRGLGLSTSLSVVTRHKGHIQVESKMGVGTVFKIYLPSSEEEPEIRDKANDMPIKGEGKVLLIDDEEIILKSVGRVLKRLGYQAQTARDHPEAIKLYKEAMKGDRPFDAVIMDLTIPGGKGGQEAVKQLKRIDRDAKVIVSSGYSDDQTMAKFREYGFCGVVAKPYVIEELARVIHNVLNGDVG